MIVDCAVYVQGRRLDGSLAPDKSFEASERSAWAAIIAVPTAIAGLYGMNVENMPELGWTYGYPLVLGAIAVMCLSLYVYFRRIGWI